MKGTLLIFLFIWIFRADGSIDVTDLQFANQGIEMLGYEGVGITITSEPYKLYMAQTLALLVKDSIYDHWYTIHFYTPGISNKERQIIISHELIHVMQFESNRLIVKKELYPIVIWEGDSLNLWDLYHYERGWKIEAYAQQDSVYNVIKRGYVK